MVLSTFKWASLSEVSFLLDTWKRYFTKFCQLVNNAENCQRMHVFILNRVFLSSAIAIGSDVLPKDKLEVCRSIYPFSPVVRTIYLFAFC